MPAPIPYRGLVEHPDLGLCSYRLTQVSDDPDTQVSQVIDFMRGYANEDARSPIIKNDCAMARSVGTGDPLQDTWNYLSRRAGYRGMQFQRDEVTAAPCDLDRWNPIVETLIRPCDQALLPRPVGDCDDFAQYGAAHLICNSVPCSYATIAADPEYPRMFSHVYLVAYPKVGPYAGMRVPMDLSHGHHLGWEHGEIFRIAEWPLGTSLSSLIGYGALGVCAYLLYKAIKKGGLN